MIPVVSLDVMIIGKILMVLRSFIKPVNVFSVPIGLGIGFTLALPNPLAP